MHIYDKILLNFFQHEIPQTILQTKLKNTDSGVLSRCVYSIIILIMYYT